MARKKHIATKNVEKVREQPSGRDLPPGDTSSYNLVTGMTEHYLRLADFALRTPLPDDSPHAEQIKVRRRGAGEK